MKRPARIAVPFIALDRLSGVTLEKQIRRALRRIIIWGIIPEGSRLPSSRIFAGVLGVSRNVILSTYEELASEGLLAARVGSGTRISALGRITAFADPDGMSLYCVADSP